MQKEYVKVFVSVPTSPMKQNVDGKFFENPPEILRAAIGALASEAVATVGNYDNVTFSSKGEGRYRAIPDSGATPSAGAIGEQHTEPEEVISFLAPKEKLELVLKTIKENHPYETPAIDVFDLVRHEFDELG